jgi:carbonic anhydrase/SulP family sulfate permease
VIDDMQEFKSSLTFPDFSLLGLHTIYVSAITIALVASLETMLNLEAVDKLDPRKRISPPNQELMAQGVGNIACGLIGGLPVTSVIVRSSVNLQAGGRTKLSAILHGILILVSLLTIPQWLNYIPLSCLAAILVATGYKLANPQVIIANMKKGFVQFIPFAVTLVTIVATDLLIGVLVGLGVSIFFILYRNLSIPLDVRIIQQDEDETVTKIFLPNQVSFLNRAVLVKALHKVPRGSQVVIDASSTYYMDPDIIELIRDFQVETDPPYDVHVTLQGFRNKFGLKD